VLDGIPEPVGVTMSPEFIAAARAEEAELVKKLEAVRGLLSAYGAGDTGAPVAPAVPVAKPKTTEWAARPKDKFTPYGQDIVDRAIAVVRAAPELPIKTKAIADVMLADGVEIRGNDPANALGALLARSSALQSLGKRGWTLTNMKDWSPQGPKENDPPDDFDVIGGPDADRRPVSGGVSITGSTPPWPTITTG
jgi:hypothetical protein